MKSILRVILLFLWIGTTFSFSQNNSQLIKEITVYFESASSVISNTEALKIEEAIQNLTDSHLYSIELSAHTDSEGSNDYNDNLSTHRAMAVADFLVNKGFFNRKISFVAQGENQPITENETDFGKAKNRRVTVKILKKFDDKLSVGGLTIEEKKVVFSVDNPPKITYSSGTIIEIPKNAFVDKNGNLVKGDVQLSYIEYRDPVDFILGNIPMDFQKNGDNFHFNSAGMFKISATQKGEEVFLKKGKNIELDFQMTDNLPDLNFYQLDAKTDKWVELNPLNSSAKDTLDKLSKINELFVDSSKKNNSNKSSWRCYDAIRYSCLGAEMASDSTLLNNLLFSESKEVIKSNKRQIKINTGKISSLDKKISIYQKLKKSTQNHCNFVAEKTQEGTEGFVINVAENPTLNRINKMVWTTTEKSNYPTDFYTKNWDWVDLMPQSDQTYSMTFKDSLTTFVIKNVQPQLKAGDKSSEKERILKLSIAALNNQKTKLAMVEQSLERYNMKKDSLEGQNGSLIKYKYFKSPKNGISKFELDRLWAFSVPYFTEVESKMSKDEWFEFFNQNNSMMKKRYSEFLNQPGFEECKTIAEQQRKAREESERLKQISEKARKKLSISTLAIYNCDQIQRLEEPLIVNATYQNEQNQVITPVFIYVVDKNINGILRYDGYNGYSPKRFAFDRNSTTILLAFASNGEVYIVGSEKFEKLTTAGKEINQNFVMTKIDKLDTKESLAGLLN